MKNSVDEPSLINESWQLWRQDDHGTKVLIGEYRSQQEAERLKQEFEDRGHRQIYWVEKIL